MDQGPCPSPPPGSRPHGHRPRRDPAAAHGLQCKEALTASLGREPTLEEISKALELPREEVSQALDAVCAPVSLYDSVYSDGGDPLTVMDQVQDTKNIEPNWMEHITLSNAFRALPNTPLMSSAPL